MIIQFTDAYMHQPVSMDVRLNINMSYYQYRDLHA